MNLELDKEKYTLEQLDKICLRCSIGIKQIDGLCLACKNEVKRK